MKRRFSTLKGHSKSLYTKIKPYQGYIIVALLAFIIGFSIRRFIPVAIVNGEGVNRIDYNKRLLKNAGAITLQQIIIEDLVTEEAKTRKVVVTKKEIEKQLGIIKNELKVQNATLDQYLAQQRTSKKDFEDQLRLQLQVKKMFEKQVKITEKDIEEFYKTYKVVKGKGAILTSQRITIETFLFQQKLQAEYAKWLNDAIKRAKIIHLMRLKS